MIARPAFSPADELQRCAGLLSKYWILAVPPAIASLAISLVIFATLVTLVGAVVAGILAGGHHAAEGAGLGFGFGSLAGLGGVALGFVALNVSQAVVMHASLAALEDRPPDLAASFAAIVPRLGDLSVSMFVSFAILFVPFVLCFVLVGIPLVLCCVFFLLYVQAAVILGGEDGISAIATSIRIARTRVGETFVLAVGVIVVSVVASAVNSVAIHIPILNLIAGFAIGGLTSAFVALATARFYLALRSPVPYGGGPTIVR